MNENNLALKTKDLHIRLTENDLCELKRLAAEQKMTVSEYFRWCAFERKIITVKVPDNNSSFIKKLIYDFEKAGNNINQIARVVNSGFVNPESFRLELRNMAQEIHNEIILLNRYLFSNDAKMAKNFPRFSVHPDPDRTMGVMSDGNY